MSPQIKPISVAETFYSIQGEGRFAGAPAVFLRLAGCNLLCGEGPDATWRCDTIEVWRKGREFNADEFRQKFVRNLEAGAHLVVTGGEPLLQDRGLVAFLASLPSGLFVELETNGTVKPSTDLDRFISSYNVSPKLSNSGMPREQRIVPEALHWLVGNTKSCFKFVVTGERDWEEIGRDFLEPFGIERCRVWLMPGADSRVSLQQLGPVVAEVAKVHGVNYSPRLHIELWDRKTGV